MEKTDYKITEFHNSEFGSIRMIEDGGRLLFLYRKVRFLSNFPIKIARLETGMKIRRHCIRRYRSLLHQSHL